jgi:hypothetical protein
LDLIHIVYDARNHKLEKKKFRDLYGVTSYGASIFRNTSVRTSILATTTAAATKTTTKC